MNHITSTPYATQSQAEAFCNAFNSIPNGGKRACWERVAAGQYVVSFI